MAARPPSRSVTEVVSSHRKGQSPSSGRFRKACTRSSISSPGRETWLFEVPVSPVARTRSSTAHVETPWMQASWSEPCRASGPSDNGERHQRILRRAAGLEE